MMEDIAEQQDVAKEISDAISNPVAFGKFFYWHTIRCELNVDGSLLNAQHCVFFFFWLTGNDIDEDELEKELEELEQEELDKELLGVSGPATELPEVPTGELKDKTKVKKKGKFEKIFYVHRACNTIFFFVNCSRCCWSSWRRRWRYEAINVVGQLIGFVIQINYKREQTKPFLSSYSLLKINQKHVSVNWSSVCDVGF